LLFGLLGILGGGGRELGIGCHYEEKGGLNPKKLKGVPCVDTQIRRTEGD